MAEIALYQIYYDSVTKELVSPPFRSLDNTEGRRDWYEFWPILDFLRNHELDPETWYGFVSPKFLKKSLMCWDDIVSLIETHPEAEVALFSYNWPELVCHRNPWLQGEFRHPGLLQASEAFFRQLGHGGG